MVMVMEEFDISDLLRKPNKDFGYCDWCGTHQKVKQSFDLRRMLCVDQEKCLTRVPAGTKSQFGSKEIIMFDCIVPQCTNKSIRQNGRCQVHTATRQMLDITTEYRHGTEGRYKAGCRCGDCRKAHSDFRRMHNGKEQYLQLKHIPEAVHINEALIDYVLEMLYYGKPDCEIVQVYDSKLRMSKYEIRKIGEPKTVEDMKTLSDSELLGLFPEESSD